MVSSSAIVNGRDLLLSRGVAVEWSHWETAAGGRDDDGNDIIAGSPLEPSNPALPYNLSQEFGGSTRILDDADSAISPPTGVSFVRGGVSSRGALSALVLTSSHLLTSVPSTPVRAIDVTLGILPLLVLLVVRPAG
ncbi:hypothetical protein Cni_G07373 [Canna indica]|uniref:Uncharacterized protein n=1 Tax=Canna indica TaxID=4628 RepID=A0AAQ3JZ04_9LILI|nr:hypothetical protein Cni_G07373 [Canna indica]